VATMEINNL